MGLEWNSMDKIASGKSLEDCGNVMGYDTKCGLAESAADWTAQLSNITSSNIGSIICVSQRTAWASLSGDV